MALNKATEVKKASLNGRTRAFSLPVAWMRPLQTGMSNLPNRQKNFLNIDVQSYTCA
jgi:hypothetical protein